MASDQSDHTYTGFHFRLSSGLLYVCLPSNSGKGIVIRSLTAWTKSTHQTPYQKLCTHDVGIEVCALFEKVRSKREQTYSSAI